MLEVSSHGLELNDAVLLLAILQANVAQITADRDLQARYAALEAIPEDDLRRPISISALAASLGLPFETVRRRLGRLAGAGLCEATERGYRIPGEVLRRPEFAQAPQKIQDMLAALADALAKTGFQPPMTLVVEPPRPRIAARLATDYFLRMLAMLVDRTEDPVDGFLLLAMLDAGPRPATAAEIARRFGMTHETTRRRLWRLEAKGFCGRARGGWLLPPASRAALRVEEALEENLAHLRLMFSGLIRLGVMAAPA